MKKYSFRNFGYIPTYSVRESIVSFIFGVPNLLKRLQARSIMKFINVKRGENILDYGCGSGYLSVEMHRANAKISGIDVNKMNTHDALRDCYGVIVDIVKPDSTRTKYKGEEFDKIVASEVLPMIENPENFFLEFHRLLKKNGQLIIINGFGHSRIERLYEKKSLLYKILKNLYAKSFPETYDEYFKILNKSFGTAQNKFLTVEQVKSYAQKHNFEVLEIDSSLSQCKSDIFSIFQFIYFLRKSFSIFPRRYFYFLYPFICLIDFFVPFQKSEVHKMIRCQKINIR